MPAYLHPDATFSGPVVHVIDGDGLCVAVGPGHSNWVEVRLADFFAPESSDVGGPAAKAALERVALGKKVSCLADRRTYDRIAARCSIDGRPVGESLRRAGIAEGGRGLEVSEAPFKPVGRSTTNAWPAPAQPSARRAGGAKFYSCRDARAAGAAPMHRGEPGYNPNLDGDADGIACEPYRGR
ncbi:excalibur calcium-binding domain-containing protein [Phenylobacterium sp. LjRoot219]|uniref:thermonuclease family protein n=1 Tax=Phenylobacterium sp. LjRoot219 TaxID=3342283 RepID=UPI003ECDAE1B